MRPRWQHEADPAACLALQDKCFPQTIAVCQTRASGLGLTVKVSDEASFEYGDDVCGVMVQYPATDGRVLDYSVSLCDFTCGAEVLHLSHSWCKVCGLLSQSCPGMSTTFGGRNQYEFDLSIMCRAPVD